MVIDWRNPEKLRVEIKAGLSGKDLEPKNLKYYPVCFQAPTYVDVEFINDNEDKDEEEGKGKASGKGGSGGKKPKTDDKLTAMKSLASDAFGQVMEGKIPELGTITEMVVMGKEIAREAYGNVLHKMAEQLQKGKITATELVAQAGKFVTKVAPPSFLEPKGEVDVPYKYDREKNADIGYRAAPS